MAQICLQEGHMALKTQKSSLHTKIYGTSFQTNLAFLLKIWYGTNFEIYSKENISNQLKMIYSPLFSKNAFMYNIGTNIILHKYGKFPSINNFRDLLVNPILPSDLV